MKRKLIILVLTSFLLVSCQNFNNYRDGRFAFNSEVVIWYIDINDLSNSGFRLFPSTNWFR